VSALVVARVVHYVAIAQAFGALTFVTAIAGRRLDVDAAMQPLRRSVASILSWSVVVALVSWLAWLAVQVPEMTGVALRHALGDSTFWQVLRDTSFGHAWSARLLLIVALAALLALRRRSVPDAHRAVIDAAATAAGAAAIATLAATGHSAADAGYDRFVHIAANALHLIAAGAWLGALLPLAMALRVATDPVQAYGLVQRFSTVGFAAVGVLIATGIVNSLYLVASWPALFGTEYGRLLIAKIALFAVMVALAAANRLRSTPQLVRGGVGPVGAAVRIARNARLEAALGGVILAIVGVLGVSVPAAHDQPSWPFPFRVAFDKGTLPSIVPAYPTTYARSPTRYSVTSIARGSTLYEANCARCHGSEGHGDGLAARTLATRPADLASEHVLDHSDGDLYWWITHGISGTPMPAFNAILDEPSRWDLVNFVKTIAIATVLRNSNTPPIDVRAPEFTFQIDLGPQQSSTGADASAATLLVLYALPQSRERLLGLAAAAADLARAGIRIVAAASRGDAAPAIDDPRIAEIAATASPGLAQTYRLFGRNLATSDREHLEFLIDRDGRLRARWGADSVPRADELAHRVRTFDTDGRRSPRPIAQPHGH